MFSHLPLVVFLIGLISVSALVVPAPGPVDQYSEYPTPTSKPWVPGTFPGLPTGFMPPPIYHSTGTVPHSSVHTHVHTHKSFDTGIPHTPLPYPTTYPANSHPTFPTGFPIFPPYPYKHVSKSTFSTVKSTGWRHSHVPMPTGCADESTRSTGGWKDSTAARPTGTAAVGYGSGGW
ncbi:hypothetical protein PtrSN002B_008225 [Pyrenophora tritici-repentis]|nr:uncharacterized protein PTRG_10184 [Pyrenophora tritici-repentis Pt-1C-BFP]KAA8620795.1 hypothetical protein PtrV1_05296 [Pyrenophora tritici-repentis]EDU43235.1 predicted protein [Pyrenophora tritici-repentis Pt-1C-BFP]KAF7450040.1 hypothetical protein A1F99_046560 [Pyrenophora tritici-repentis]KAI1509580.1 hypothetical protein Ptr86124_011660 [Pyrenophora tritici-repentis]KAI1542189.1 hypothetical protein PtrSN002B_008225 [Pyrenophora tritici-repentis]